MLALQHTSVANVLVILASNPIFSAFFSFILLQEKVNLRTMITGIICFNCIGFIFYQNINVESDSESTKGIIFAIFAAITYALYFVLIRVADKYQG